MRYGFRFIPLGMVLGTFIISGCGGKHEADRAATPPPAVTGVSQEQVVAGAIAEGLEAVGTVKSRNSAVLAARLSGTVTAVHVREGERVGRGKLLVNIEAVESVAQAASASAGADEATRALEEARARRRLADSTYDRYKRLFDEQAVTRQELENRQADRDVAREGVARAEARLASAREASRAAGVVAGYTRITAPIGGIITAKQVDAGMTVFPGMPLITVEEEGSYRLEAAVPESLMAKVKVGQQVRVTIDTAAIDTNGRIAEVVPAADPASRTFTVKVDLAGKGLRSGMFGRAFFPTGIRQGVTVPKQAVVDRGALTSVWVVDNGSIARLRLVRTGAVHGDRVEILSGLAGGERIVTNGVAKVSEGAKIQ